MAKSKRISFDRLILDQLPAGCRATVKLAWQNQTYLGSADVTGLEQELPCAARAAADALGQVLGGDGSIFEVVDLQTIKILETQGIVVALSVNYPETPYLVGICLVTEDPPRAAVRAVLNSTNRFFERLWSAGLY